MKALLPILLVLLLAGVAQANDPLKVDQLDAVADIAERVDIAGTIDATDPTWHRWRGNDYSMVSLDCALDMTYEYSTDPYYEVHCITVTDTSPIEIWTAPITGQFDTVLYLYCDPFDPANSTENCITVDDDSGEGLLSHIGVLTPFGLVPGEQYWVVVCGYSPSSQGEYLIQTTPNVILCTTPVDEIGWGSLKALYR
jgi:hypothetical protein